ncbi:CgeB family protein [Frigidibacter oleivorans]|uniref:CgeB family protein n=1 Tax=Frigidibacter oleivorans TaxID=2487129 RepID=UPI000F8F4E7A|nr:glycosyltransferase [Frigidibacter oleivorans]
MRFLFYTHSLISDWNHGNAHFLRGVMRELLALGHRATALEPEDSWSRRNLLADQGPQAVAAFHRDFPMLESQVYGEGFDHAAALDGADVVIVHEWTDPALVARIGALRQAGGRFTLLFHDTHHRAVSREGEIAGLDLSGYDGILAFGETLRDRYLKAGWGRQVFTWHEAADTALFRPIEAEAEGDLIWIGNWGDDERSAELAEFLMEPARDLGLRTTVRGVRYPDEALERLRAAGIRHEGWIPNAEVPAAFARHRVTVHVPRRPYVRELPGIPTIRPFEALACGIPLVSAPWSDSEDLFRPGDFRWAGDGDAMRRHLHELTHDPAARAEQAARGLQTIRARHSCAHRVQELLSILDRLGGRRGAAPGRAAPEPNPERNMA